MEETVCAGAPGGRGRVLLSHCGRKVQATFRGWKGTESAEPGEPCLGDKEGFEGRDREGCCSFWEEH